MIPSSREPRWHYLIPPFYARTCETGAQSRRRARNLQNRAHIAAYLLLRISANSVNSVSDSSGRFVFLRRERMRRRTRKRGRVPSEAKSRATSTRGDQDRPGFINRSLICAPRFIPSSIPFLCAFFTMMLIVAGNLSRGSIICRVKVEGTPRRGATYTRSYTLGRLRSRKICFCVRETCLGSAKLASNFCSILVDLRCTCYDEIMGQVSQLTPYLPGARKRTYGDLYTRSLIVSHLSKDDIKIKRSTCTHGESIL